MTVIDINVLLMYFYRMRNEVCQKSLIDILQWTKMNSEQHALPATTQAQQEVRDHYPVADRLYTKLQMRKWRSHGRAVPLLDILRHLYDELCWFLDYFYLNLLW